MTQPSAISSTATLRRQPMIALDSVLRSIARPLMLRAARAYVAGDTLASALAVQAALADENRYATLGYWNGDTEEPPAVLARYLAAVAALESNRFAGSCSIKLPSLKFQTSLLRELAAAATKSGVALHCDSQEIEHADRIFQAVDAWRQDGLLAGVTLPGRWRRSLDDARWVAKHGLSVRVVKGQWADPSDPVRDPSSGFLEVIDALAVAGARRVAVATHDLPLATKAIERLRGAGISATMELLYGLPLRSSLALAIRLKVDVRVYVPYGAGYLPYALSKLISQPGVARRFLRDLVIGGMTPARRLG
jgi:proline dehydrogenase